MTIEIGDEFLARNLHSVRGFSSAMFDYQRAFTFMNHPQCLVSEVLFVKCTSVIFGSLLCCWDYSCITSVHIYLYTYIIYTYIHFIHEIRTIMIFIRVATMIMTIIILSYTLSINLSISLSLYLSISPSH